MCAAEESGRFTTWTQPPPPPPLPNRRTSEPAKHEARALPVELSCHMLRRGPVFLVLAWSLPAHPPLGPVRFCLFCPLFSGFPCHVACCVCVSVPRGSAVFCIITFSSCLSSFFGCDWQWGRSHTVIPRI